MTILNCYPPVDELAEKYASINCAALIAANPYSDTEMRPVTGAYLCKFNMGQVKQLMVLFGIIRPTKHHMPG